MRNTYVIFLVAIATCWSGGLSDEDIPSPEKRLISTFQIVRFPNDACVGTGGRNGTCYTSAECSDKAGTSSGSCADGFGVCCTFLVDSCDQTSSENITYWDMTPTVVTTGPSGCNLKVCPMNDNICQLRIDFTTFVVTGPSTISVMEHFKQLGSIPKSGEGWVVGDSENSWATNCLVDSFSVNGKTSANVPPVICGTNTGTHMYVDADMDSCNNLSFRFSAMPGSTNPIIVGVIDTRGVTALATRDWDITVLQYECGDILAAPPGCTQYFHGITTGRIMTYNFAGGFHLANQNQKVCIRRERTFCFTCLSDEDISVNFRFAGQNNVDNAYTSPGQACGYSCDAANGLGNANNQCGAFDCVILPGIFVVAIAAMKGAPDVDADSALIRSQLVANANVPSPPQISSNGKLGIGAADLANVYETDAGSAVRTTMCTKHYPFMLQFKSDAWEGQGEDGEHILPSPGISLPWWQVSCT